MESRATVQVAMSPHVEAAFAKAVSKGDLEPILDAIAAAGFQASAATRTSDRAAVLAAVGDPAAASAAVRAQLRAWVFSRALAQFDALPPAERGVAPLGAQLAAQLKAHGRFDDAEAVLREQLRCNREVGGDASPNTLASMNNLGGLLYSAGERLEEALELFGGALAVQRETFGACSAFPLSLHHHDSS